MLGVKGRIIGRRIAGCLTTAAVAWPLSACQSVTQPQTTALVRVLDASYNAPAVDVYAGKTEIAKNVGPGSITNYAILTPGPVTITVDATGTRKALATVTTDLRAAAQRSVYLVDKGSGFDAKLLKDQAQPPPLGEFSARFFRTADATGAVDVYYLTTGERVADAMPVVKGLAPGQNSSYVNLPDGTYRLVVTRAGHTSPVFTGSSVTYAGGQVRTVLIAGGSTVEPKTVQVVVGDDSN